MQLFFMMYLELKIVTAELFSFRGMPLPVADLFQILTKLSNILLVFDQFVIHLLNQMSALVAKLRQMHDYIFYKVETVNLVLYTHIKWCCNCSFLQISVNRHIRDYDVCMSVHESVSDNRGMQRLPVYLW